MRSSRHPVARLSQLVLCLVVALAFGWSAAPSGSAQEPNAIYLPLVAKPCLPAVIPSSGSWLDYLNYYRASACLPPVAEGPALSEGDRQHAVYTVKNDVLQHDEDPANPWYTPEGRAAAQQSNLAASYDANASDWWAIDTWMQAPFHAVGVLDPRLTEVGYGSYREADGNLQMGAALNVIAGLGPGAELRQPVFWPGQGVSVPIRLHWGEYPSPLTSCPGYTAPSGLPLIVQVGAAPTVSASSLTRDGQPLEHCVFDENTYANPDGAAQALGRGVLGSRHAVVLIPRLPLAAGATYTASLTVNGRLHSWSFSISADAQASANQIGAAVVR